MLIIKSRTGLVVEVGGETVHINARIDKPSNRVRYEIDADKDSGFTFTPSPSTRQRRANSCAATPERPPIGALRKSG